MSRLPAEVFMSLRLKEQGPAQGTKAGLASGVLVPLLVSGGQGSPAACHRAPVSSETCLAERCRWLPARAGPRTRLRSALQGPWPLEQHTYQAGAADTLCREAPFGLGRREALGDPHTGIACVPWTKRDSPSPLPAL